jgi:hypothetical protein
LVVKAQIVWGMAKNRQDCVIMRDMSNSEPSKPKGSGSSARSAVEDSVEQPARDADEATVAGEEAPHVLPPMDFSMFVMSLGSSAMVNLGQLPPPEGMEAPMDLAAAKQIIDILGVLEEKTRGNLDESEDKLLASLLYDLRVHYVDAQARKK